MIEVSTIGFDLAKRVFQVHGLDGEGAVTIRRQLRRPEVVKFFTKLSPCVVGMEAGASAHYWARTLAKLGHDVRLISPAQVKPYVKRGRKNDAADAAAIAEAVTRPHMQFVPVKSEEAQAILMLHRTRRLLITQRTMLGNALRSHFAEYGIVEPEGQGGLARLVACALDATDTALPQAAREAMAMLAAHVRDTDAKIDALDHEILRWHRDSADSQRVASIPGIGPLIASAIVATMGDPTRFKTGRDFAAWLGLVPSQNSTGGKTVLGPITKAINLIGSRSADHIMASGHSAAQTGRTHDCTRPGRDHAKISLQRRGRPHMRRVAPAPIAGAAVPPRRGKRRP